MHRDGIPVSSTIDPGGGGDAAAPWVVMANAASIAPLETTARQPFDMWVTTPLPAGPPRRVPRLGNGEW